MNNKKTFYWYDYETFGLSPKTNRISQFAGVRTDQDLNILSKTMFYCKPTRDCLPSPTSCLVTKISPQLCEKQGFIEHEFIAKIHREFTQPNTCVVGYNSTAFDDEFTRHTLYRNFFNPYSWHYKNNNSRWDFINVIRICYAFKKHDSINWVYNNKNLPVFKLDQLTAANGIAHANSHDALSDTLALVEIAKKIKQTQPDLFNYALELSLPQNVHKNIKLFKPILYTSSYFSTQQSCTQLCVPLAYHPEYKKRMIVFNLHQDPKILLKHNINDLKKLIFTKKTEQTNDFQRLQFTELVFNKSPMFCVFEDISKIPASIVKNLQINTSESIKNLEFIKNNETQITKVIQSIYKNDTPFLSAEDVDQSIYDNFLSRNDEYICNEIQRLTPTQIKNYSPDFTDPKLKKLFFYFKARNYSKYLTAKEQQDWAQIVKSRVQHGTHEYISLDNYFEEIKILQKQHPEKQKLWQELKDFGNSFNN